MIHTSGMAFKKLITNTYNATKTFSLCSHFIFQVFIKHQVSGCFSLDFLVSDILSQMLNFDITYIANGFQILSAEVILKTIQTMETRIQKNTYV